MILFSEVSANVWVQKSKNYAQNDKILCYYGKGREKVKKNSKIKKSCLLNSVFFCQPGWNISVFSSLQGGLAASSIYCRACRYFHGHGSSFLTIKHFQMWHKLFLIFTSVLMRVQAKRRFSVLKSWVILFQKYRPMFECKNQKIMCKMIKFFVMRNRPEGGGGVTGCSERMKDQQ